MTTCERIAVSPIGGALGAKIGGVDIVACGEEWRTNTTMMPAAPMGAIRYALEAPP